MNTITRLAVNNDKKNKIRSILVIVSIMLTTMLLTMIATFCYGTIKSNILNAGQLYGNFYGIYYKVNLEQLEQMQLRGEFGRIGKTAYAGEVEHKNTILLYMADETAGNLTNISEQLEEGVFPTKENEIVGQKNMFVELGYDNPKIGDKIILKTRINSESKFKPQEFTITGLLKESKTQTLRESYGGLVSEKFYNELVTTKNRSYSIYFDLNKSVEITSRNAEEVLQELALKCGIEKENVSANNFFLMWTLNPGTETIGVGVVISFVVILFSVLVIYNIFQVGIVQKIQEYGKIKALGATKKQIKQVVLLEGMVLSVLGIPMGLLLGCVGGKAVFGWLTKQLDFVGKETQFMEASIFSIPLLFLVILISFLTVVLALKKPMKIVARISPVEALLYQENGKRKQSVRKGNKTVGVKEMMFANMSANRKRMIMTICTMGLSCVLFVVISNFVGNMDSEYDARQTIEHGQFEIGLDYSLEDLAYPENNLDYILKEDPLGDDMLSKIEQIDGVTDVITRKILVAGQADTMESIGVISREDFNVMNEKDTNIGLLDYDKASETNGIFYGYSHFMEQEGYTLNQKVEMQLDNGDVKMPFEGTLQGAFGSFDQKWIITENTYDRLGFQEAKLGYIWVDCKKKDIPNVQRALEELVSDRTHVELDSYQAALQLSQLSMKAMKFFCYAFLLIIGMIGFMNMANTMIVSIVTRKQEIGVLQAIGMTNHQLNQMLQMEGMIYTIGTVFIALIIGIPGGYALFAYGKSQGLIGLNLYHFPVFEITAMIALIAMLQIILSFALSKNIRNESLVERIRY